MDDIALKILGIIEEKPLTVKDLKKKKKNKEILSRVHKDDLDLRPYFFKELDKQEIVYVDKIIIKKGKKEKIIGYFKDGKKINGSPEQFY